MTSYAAWAVWTAAIVLGIYTAAITGAIQEARRPQPQPVEGPCRCTHCTVPMATTEEYHFQLWQQEVDQ